MAEKQNKQKVAFLKSELKNYSEKLKEELKIGIDTEVSEIKDFHIGLFDGENSKEKEIQNLIGILEEYEKEYQSIKSYYRELLDGDDENISIKEEIGETLEEIKSYKKELLEGNNGGKSIQESIKDIYIGLRKYDEAVFGVEEEKDEEGNIIIKGDNGLKGKLDTLYKEKKVEFDELKVKIEGLMGSAIGVGLSEEYARMGKKFFWPKFIWNGVFIFALFIVMFFSKDLIPGETLEDTLNMLFAHLPFIGAFVWLAYFASKKQSQSVRLEQEYAHKESFAKSFEGYRNQVEKLGDDEKSLKIQQLLMENLVKMTGDNPSETLDKNHGTNPPFWEYFFGRKK